MDFKLACLLYMDFRKVGKGPFRKVGKGPFRELGNGPFRKVGKGPFREVKKVDMGIFMSAALSKDGVVGRKPLLGSYNTAHLIVFLNDIEQACQGEGVTYVIVWDNARFHHAEVVQTWFWAHSRFVTRYLPPYTPFLNPIEDLFPHGGGRCTITIHSFPQPY
jgi:hypothetical protein